MVDYSNAYPCSLCAGADYWMAHPPHTLFSFTFRIYTTMDPVAEPPKKKKIQKFKPPKLRDMHPLIKKQKPLLNCKQMKKNNAKYKKSHR